MEIMLNGQPYGVSESLTVPELLQQLGLEGKRLAVELNRAILPRSQYEGTSIQPGDAIEIVHAIGGG